MFSVPYVSSAGSSFYLNHLRSQKIADFKMIKVETVTFDQLIRSLRLECIDIMKMDLEGAELSVLYGMSHSLSNKLVRKLIIEIHKTVNSPDEIIKLLIEKGYTIDAYFDISGIKGMLYARA